MKGAVAGGSPLTVEAGLEALRAGGNAVDAAVAAQLTACAAEPLLTGLGGGGLGMVRVAGKTVTCDFFSTAPSKSGPMTTVELDFGPTTQVFHVGAASIALPGLPAGLWAMHQRWGRVPMRELIQPAVAAARDGIVVDPCFARVNELLWPIQQLTPRAAALYGRDGRPLVQGERFHNPDLAATLLAYAEEGPELFRTGHVAELLLEAAPNLCAEDLRGYQPLFSEPLAVPYRDATVFLPGVPSQGGFQVAKALRELNEGPMPEPFGYDHVQRLAHAMHTAERIDGLFADRIFDPGFVRAYLGSGFTTQISVVDGQGNAAAVTSSLGETAGLVLGDSGISPNNFLGEEDVNPPGHEAPPGRRLVTMCCPTLVAGPDRVYALGSGGSSRIRSAVLHGVVYLVDHALDPGAVPRLPRCHMQGGVLRLEGFDRDPDCVAELQDEHPRLVLFERPDMYFGGLHIAGLVPRGFVGGGDPRRSGAFEVT